MGRYYFGHTDDSGQHVSVMFDDTERYHISDVLTAFRAFLLGVTFQPATIEKYIDVNKVYLDQLERGR